MKTSDFVSDVRSIADDLGVWNRFEEGVRGMLNHASANRLISRLGALPVVPSRAVGFLGAYVSRGSLPVCIRLQFHQERELLGGTLLHELAHACDHLSRHPLRAYRRAHGPRWQEWARALGADPQCTAHSPNLNELRETRLKVVAVCQKCGFEFRRLRQFSQKQKKRGLVHPACGNGLVLPL